MGRRRAETAAAAAADTSSGESSPAKLPVGRHFGPAHKAPLWLKITAIAVSAVFVLVAGTAGALYLKLQGNVTTAPLNAAVSPSKNAEKAESSGSMQVLILGTDTRDGKNSQYGTEADSTGDGNSDVMLLLNINADNTQASVTSFPRDLMVPIPDCKNSKGDVVQGQEMGQLNSALSIAGPGCTVATINQMTGLTIDHFMLADFTAVKELSTALGGVEVCVDHAMYDVNGSFLKLPKGKSVIKGEQALAFLRTRHAWGDASDLARIKAQQYFLGSMVRKVKSEGTLTNLPKVYNLADVVTKNLTIDSDLANPASMIDIANRLSKINIDNVAFVTVPNQEYVGDPARVQLQEPNAGQFFSALRADTNLTKAPAKSTAKATTKATSTPSPTKQGSLATPSGSAAATQAPTSKAPAVPAYDKAAQPLAVQNGSAVAGRGEEILAQLRAKGFTLLTSLGDSTSQKQTQVLYGANMGDVAQDVATLFKIPKSAVKSDPNIGGVQIVVGTDWTAGNSYGQVVVPKDIVSSTAGQNAGCLAVNPLYYVD